MAGSQYHSGDLELNGAQYWRTGQMMNMETDILGKYVGQMLTYFLPGNHDVQEGQRGTSRLSVEFYGRTVSSRRLKLSPDEDKLCLFAVRKQQLKIFAKAR